MSASNPLSQSTPTVSSNGVIGYSTLQFNVPPSTLGDSYVDQLDNATAPARSANIQVEYGGGLDQLTRPKANDLRSEAIGFAVALIVLLLIFGSVIGAILPLLTALISVVAGISILGLAAASLTFGTASPTLAAMIGIGVGIDYAVFLTTRFRQQIIDGADPVDAAGFCTTTSGRAVLLAAGTVAVAMLGLYASGIVFVGLLGLAAVFGVVTAAIGAVTLVPALLGLAGRRIDKLKVRKVPVAETGSSGDSWHKYAALIGRLPWLFLVGGLALLCVLAIPLLSIRDRARRRRRRPDQLHRQAGLRPDQPGVRPRLQRPVHHRRRHRPERLRRHLARRQGAVRAGRHQRRRQGHAAVPHAGRRAAHRDRHPDHRPAGPGDHQPVQHPG